MSRLSRMLTLCVAAVAVASVLFLGGTPGRAAPKPKPPGGGGSGGAVPPGTIFYNEYDNDFYDEFAMKADGSGKLPTIIPRAVPEARFPADISKLVYGNDPTIDRWSLQVQFVGVDPDQGVSVYEVFAVRPVVDENGLLGYDSVQLTELWPDYRVAMPSENNCRWSIDGEDSFLSFRADERVWDENDGKWLTVSNHLFRLDVSGTMIELAHQMDVDLKVLAGDPALVLTLTAPYVSARNFRPHEFSRDGTKLAYMERHPDDPGNFPLLMVATDLDADTPTVTEMPYNSPDFHWSPATDRLIFSRNDNIMTMAADGTDVRTLLARTSNTIYYQPIWSPDGQYVAYTRGRWRGWTLETYIERIPAAGGTAILMTGDLNKDVRKNPLNWLTDNSGLPSP